MKWYEYRQNNTGGRFIGPALYVFVEALNGDVADAIAERLGIYFNGCYSGQDCSCCGDRWTSSYGMGDDQKPEPYSHGQKRAEEEGLIYAIYVYNSGGSIDFVGVPSSIKCGEEIKRMQEKLID